VIRVNVWSGPRNVSTALMYSWRQHPMVAVVDEPLYAHWLRLSGADHPGRDDVLAAMEQDGDRVVAALLSDEWHLPDGRPAPALVCKQMAHHLVGVDETWLDAFTNVLLIRDPREVLLSYTEAVEHPDVHMLGYPTLVRLLERERDSGRSPLVVDSADLLADPETTLRRMTAHAGLSFDPAMLSWPAGPKPEDGVWARYWYAGVHASTGFRTPRPRDGDVPDRLRPVLEAALPLYERLRAATSPGHDAASR
jgi:hypothetical protein